MPVRGEPDILPVVGLLLLIRHASAEQTGRRLYGRSPGVHLSGAGRRQAARLAERLAAVRIRALYTSPMERCRETAEILVADRRLEPQVIGALNEVDYGGWTGRPFGSLARTRLWRQARHRPSEVRFPDGETLREVQARAVEALTELGRRHPRGAAAVVTHGDVVRLALAHFAGVHIDLFQRLEVFTASVTAVDLGEGGPRVLRVNDTGDLGDLVGG